MLSQYCCRECGALYPIDTMHFRCHCGGLFDLTAMSVSAASFIDPRFRGVFRYIGTMPVSERSAQRVTLCEGDTPVVKIGRDLFAKLDFLMPTLSFKDRGAAVLMAHAWECGFGDVIQDSSGNAGCAVAAYAARAGIRATIFLGSSTPDKKIEQIRNYSAAVRMIDGDRLAVAAAALEEAQKGAAFYASHVYNPFFTQGTKTYIFEAYESFAGKLPERIFVPVGNGTLLIGVVQGLRELAAMCLIDKYPQVIAIQAEGCMPLYRAFAAGQRSVLPVTPSDTLADGIAIAAPARGAQILELLREMGGDMVAVSEAEIIAAMQTLASQGLYVEATSAANYAGWLKYTESCGSQATSLIPLCGAGLKNH